MDVMEDSDSFSWLADLGLDLDVEYRPSTDTTLNIEGDNQYETDGYHQSEQGEGDSILPDDRKDSSTPIPVDDSDDEGPSFGESYHVREALEEEINAPRRNIVVLAQRGAVVVTEFFIAFVKEYVHWYNTCENCHKEHVPRSIVYACQGRGMEFYEMINGLQSPLHEDVVIEETSLLLCDATRETIERAKLAASGRVDNVSYCTGGEIRQEPANCVDKEVPRRSTNRRSELLRSPSIKFGVEYSEYCKQRTMAASTSTDETQGTIYQNNRSEEQYQSKPPASVRVRKKRTTMMKANKRTTTTTIPAYALGLTLDNQLSPKLDPNESLYDFKLPAIPHK